MQNTMQENTMAPVQEFEQAQEGVTAQDLSESLMTGEQERQEEESEAMAARIREGIGALFEDGWTSEELAQLSQDAQVRNDIADGKDVIRAAAAYLRRQLIMAQQAQAMKRRGVPVAKTASSGAPAMENRIEQMTDAQFDAFSREARTAAMMGRKIRM